MGLQLRIRHALGSRTIEIPGRGGDNPVRVGRDASCDVPIPSGQVAPVHCYLYMHEGQWIVASAGPALYLNGEELGEPRFIGCGDRISLGTGPSASVIDIDPVGAARQVATAAPPPSSRPRMPSADAFASAAAVNGGGGGGGWNPPPAPEAAQVGPGDGLDSDEYVPLQSGGEPAAPMHRVRRRARQQSDVGLAVGLVVGLVVCGIVVIMMIVRSREQTPAPVVKPAPPAETVVDLGPGRRNRTNIFDNPKPNPVPVRSVVPPVEPSEPVKPANPDEEVAAKPAQADPRRQTDEWQNVEQMRSSLDTAAAIWVFDEYLRRHPGEFEEELKKDIEASLDRLWWERIKKLMDNKKECQAEIEKKKSDLLEEKPDSEFAVNLTKEIDNLKFRVQSIDEMLRADMAYSSDLTPNLSDDAQLAVLRGQRDKGVFEKWSRKVLEHIRTHNGKPPWTR